MTTLRVYGLTKVDWDEMMVRQGYRCAICKRKPERWDVDHNHDHGGVREALCHGCNSGLGWFADRADWLRAAAAYIERHDQTKFSFPQSVAASPPTRIRSGNPPT